MDTKTVHKQPQVLLRGSGLSGSVYQNLIPILFISWILSYFLKIWPECPLIKKTKIVDCFKTKLKTFLLFEKAFSV